MTRTSLTYENGDYPASLDRAAELMEAGPPPPADGRARGSASRATSSSRAIGPTSTNKVLGVRVGTYETATVRMANDGSLSRHTGSSPHGQGHETSFAQIAADRLGVPLERISLIHSDTDVTPYSPYGTAASRSITVGGGALVRAAEAAGATRSARSPASSSRRRAEDLVLAEGRAGVAGTTAGVSLADVAAHAWRGYDLPDGMTPGLVDTFVLDPANLSFSYGTHACQVAVDRATGMVEVERFVVVHDCGTVVNPLIVDGPGPRGRGAGPGIGPAGGGRLRRRWSAAHVDLPRLPPADVVHHARRADRAHRAPVAAHPRRHEGHGGGRHHRRSGRHPQRHRRRACPTLAARITDIPMTPSRLWELLQDTAGA